MITRIILDRMTGKIVIMKLSDKDRQLLAVLMGNARMPITEIARRLGVARTTAQARLDRLEEEGIITGYVPRLSDAYTQGLLRAHAMITISPKSLNKVITALRNMDEVQSVHSVSGAFDLIADVAADSVPGLDRALDRIGAIEGVEKTKSSIILSTRFQR